MSDVCNVLKLPRELYLKLKVTIGRFDVVAQYDLGPGLGECFGPSLCKTKHHDIIIS
jgi:hypothetical protein